MVAFVMKNFGGTIPKLSPVDIPDNMAEAVFNADLSSGALNGLPQPVLVEDFSGYTFPYDISGSSSTTVQRAYRYPDPTDSGGADVWLPLPHYLSSVVRSPLANDPDHRLYWTIPGLLAPKWATYAMLQAGTAPYDLGTIQPSPTTGLAVDPTGGTTDGSVPEVARSYCFTHINQYGEESAPNLPSDIVTGPPDATWTISGLPLTAPSNPTGFNYPPITQLRLYRTVTGTQSGAQFFEVDTFTYGGPNPPVSGYVDATTDALLVNNLTLPSASWANPVFGMWGITALPGGMLVGISGNTLCFCEPNHPHAWPPAYEQSVQYDIQALAVWQQQLVVLTKGYPALGAGSSPPNFLLNELRVPEPCISIGGPVTDLMGVYYPSQNGLVFLNYFGMQNQTLSLVTKNLWLSEFSVADTVACRHRSQYLAVNPGSAQGFLIDYSDQRMGIAKLSLWKTADPPWPGSITAVWNDEYSGDAYLCAGGQVFLWDSPAAGPMIYRWRSKQFYLPAPVSMGACQVECDSNITGPFPADPFPLDTGDPLLVLPAGVYATITIYAGPDQSYTVGTWNLTQKRNIFRLPSGFKAFCWQVEIVARAGVRSIQLASTMKELKNV